MIKSGWITLGALLFLLMACGGGQTAVPAPPTPPISAIETAVPTLPPPTTTPTPTDEPTATAVPPSATPSPLPPPATPSTTPSATPTATSTATPTALPTAVPASPTASAISLADLPNHNGQAVTVNGRVVAAASFSSGFKFTLDDGNGRAVLLLWHHVYDDAWDAPQLNVGATVRATGQVGQFEGEWQVVPDFGGDVKVTAPGGAFAPARAIGELNNHVGELVEISGVIVRLEATSSAVKIFVSDDTGEIVVFVWRTILDRIPNNTALGQPGTRVRVNGRVELYRSNLEIVPALPYDVEVLR